MTASNDAVMSQAAIDALLGGAAAGSPAPPPAPPAATTAVPAPRPVAKAAPIVDPGEAPVVVRKVGAEVRKQPVPLLERIAAMQEEVDQLRTALAPVLVELRDFLRSAPGAVHFSPAADEAEVAPPACLDAVERPPLPRADGPGWHWPALTGGADDPRPAPFSDEDTGDFGLADGYSALAWAPVPAPRLMDTYDLAAIGRWATMAHRQVGHEGVQQALNIYELLRGELPPGLATAIVRLSRMLGTEPATGPAEADGLAHVLTSLSSVLGSAEPRDRVLLDLLTQPP